MTRTFRLSLALLAALLIAAAPAAARKPRLFQVTTKANSRTIHLKKHDRLRVELEQSTGSTAYRWRLAVRPKASILKLTSIAALPPAVTIPPTPGAPETLFYTFTAKGRGRTKLRFDLASTFKAKDRPPRHFRLRIVVG